MKINKIDTYVMVALAFMPLLVSSAVAISTIGETTNDIPTVNIERQYTTNSVSSFADAVVGNAYMLKCSVINENYYSADTVSAAVSNGFITLNDYSNISYSSFNKIYLYNNGYNHNTTYIFDYYVDVYFSSTNNRYYFRNDPTLINDFHLDYSANQGLTFGIEFRSSVDFQNTNVNFQGIIRYLDTYCCFVYNGIDNASTFSYLIKNAFDSGFVSELPITYNPIVSAELSTETIENVFVRNLTYFNDISFVKPIYNWCVTNMLGGVSNPIFDIAHSYLFYVMFLFLCYLMLSVLLFFVKFGIKALNWFYDKSFGGGS